MEFSPATIEAPLREATAIVDVRSPGEFAKGAVVGAVNIPLFSNGERAEVGTLYKLLGREQAIDKGLGFLGARLTEFVGAFAPYKSERLLVYCARGGMRSSAVVGLLGALGYRVTQLPGGYKAFRNYVLHTLAHRIPPHPIVLHGQTGVGKTLVLNRLDNALDLEALARHRSSVFGAINLQPRTQQQFEAHLLAALQRLDFARPVWIEGESRKIGSVTMPESLRTAMRRATCVLVTASRETRVARIVAEYGGADEGTLRQVEAALRSLTHPLGRERVEGMVRRVWAGDLASVVGELLEDYYDPRYAHAMRGYRYALAVSSGDPDAAAEELRRFAAEAQARWGAGGAWDEPAAKNPLPIGVSSP